MAYATTADAGFRIATNGLKHGSSTLTGGIRSTLEKIINREILQSEEENTPVSRPVDLVDCRVIHEFLDGSSFIDEGTAAANAIANFTTAGGGSGAVTLGPTVAGGFTATMARNQGGHQYQQEFLMEGTALTDTVSF